MLPEYLCFLCELNKENIFSWSSSLEITEISRVFQTGNKAGDNLLET